MNWLFAPALQVLRRMPYSRKFLLAGAALMIPLLYLFLATVMPLAQSVSMSQRMSQGANLVQAMQPLVLAVQRHRGLTNALLAGDKVDRVSLEQAAQQVEVAFREIQVLSEAEHDVFAIGTRLRELRGQWEKLAHAASGMSPEDSFAAHSGLISGMFSLTGLIADSAALNMDAEEGIHFLQDMLTVQAPPLIEALGQMRGLMVGILSRAESTDTENITDAEKIIISSLMGRAQVHAEKTVEDMEKVMAARPELAASLEPSLAEMRASVQGFQGQAIVRNIRTYLTLDSRTFFREASVPLEKAKALSDAATGVLKTLLEERRARSERIFVATIAGVLLMLTLALYLSMAMVMAITGDVRQLEQAASALAKGDLTQGLEVRSRDEMGRIAEAFEAARSEIARLVSNATHAAGQVADTAHEVVENASCCSGAANRQSESVSASAAAVEQMAVSSAHIAEQTQEASAIASEVGGISLKGEHAIREANREMNAIAASVRQAATQIEGLNVRAEEISSIVQVIRDIADQTNLLALNAAIEAARAGEQGRGFAVVADEVRKLAERTAKATTEIAATIALIQTESADAVSRMGNSQQLAKNGVATVESATQALHEIRQGVSAMLERVTEIAGASSQQKAASAGIARNVEHIAQMTESNSATAAQVSSQARQMGALVTELTTELRRFQVQAANRVVEQFAQGTRSGLTSPPASTTTPRYTGHAVKMAAFGK